MSEGVTLPAPLVERLASVLERIEAAMAHRPNPGLLKKADVAALIGGGCSVRKVERLMKDGTLKKVSGLGRKTVRFRRTEVEAALATTPPPRHGRRQL